MPFIRPLDPNNPSEIDRVADRMQKTLIEVLGPERGQAMYSMDWLRERVRYHLDETTCCGQVLLAIESATIVGHTILRIETDLADMNGEVGGLFSTSYVTPAYRRFGVADALLCAGEVWLCHQKAEVLMTDTSSTNTPLIRLFEKHGYKVTFQALDRQMVRLTKQMKQSAHEPNQRATEP